MASVKWRLPSHNSSSAGAIYTIITVPADGLVPNSAELSAMTVLNST